MGAALVIAALGLLSTNLQAKETTLDAAPLEGTKVRLDGLIKEWPALVTLSERISGSGGDDPSASGIVGYDNQNLYVALRVKDGNFVRTSALGKNEDHATLKLAFPQQGGGHKSYTVDLFAGVAGKSAGAVKVNGNSVSQAKIVEAPNAEGMSFEAQIPWSAFADAKRVRNGIKGALLYVDSDSQGKVSAIIGTSAKSEGNMPLLTTEAEYALNQGLVVDKELNVRPSRELFANLVGDDMLERIAVYDRYLAVTGWGYREGKEFFYQDLNLAKASDLILLSAADFDSDGHDEIVFVRRASSGEQAREYAEVWRFDSSDAPPKPIFQHEVGITEGTARVVNSVSLGKTKGKASLTVTRSNSVKVDPETWTALPAGEGTYPTLMPWDAIKARTYGWTGTGFALLDEKEGKAELKAPKKGGTRFYSGTGPPPGANRSGSAGNGASGSNTAGGEGGAPPAPRAPSADELQNQVYTLYRTERGHKQGKPSFDFVTNVAGDETTERVLVHGNDLVVFGRKFKSGTSYVYTTIGVKDPADILDVTARDLTGDGHAEVVVRALLKVQASKQMGGKMVTRHALFVYSVSEQGVGRIFAAETGRSLEGDMVLGLVRFVPNGNGLDIELMPGRAVGWTEQSYPYPQDKTPYGGLEPLALPWSGIAARRYGFTGTDFKQR